MSVKTVQTNKHRLAVSVHFILVSLDLSSTPFGVSFVVR